jgi:hypothetical protein
VASDLPLIEAARAQLRQVLASGNPAAFLGWWQSWKQEPGVDQNDLTDLVTAESARLENNS